MSTQKVLTTMVHCSLNTNIYSSSVTTLDVKHKFKILCFELCFSTRRSPVSILMEPKQQYNVHLRIPMMYRNPFLEVFLDTKISQLDTDKVLLIFHSIKVEPVARHCQISSSVYITVIFLLHVEPEPNSRIHSIMTYEVWSCISSHIAAKVILKNVPQVAAGS